MSSSTSQTITIPPTIEQAQAALETLRALAASQQRNNDVWSALSSMGGIAQAADNLDAIRNATKSALSLFKAYPMIKSMTIHSAVVHEKDWEGQYHDHVENSISDLRFTSDLAQEDKDLVESALLSLLNYPPDEEEDEDEDECDVDSSNLEREQESARLRSLGADISHYWVCEPHELGDAMSAASSTIATLSLTSEKAQALSQEDIDVAALELFPAVMTNIATRLEMTHLLPEDSRASRPRPRG